MLHHFGISARTARKIQQHYVGIFVGIGRTGKRVGKLLIKIVESLPFVARAAHGNQFFYARSLFYSRFNFFLHGIVKRHNHLYAGGVDTKRDVFGNQHICCRHSDCADFVQCQNEPPKLISAPQNEHNSIAFFYPARYKIMRRFVYAFCYISKRKNLFAPMVITPHKRAFLRTFSGVAVHYVVSKIKIVRNFNAEIGF